LNIGTKFIRVKKIALPCPALCPGCPQGNQGRAKKKFCPAGQGRASGRANSPALMTVSAR